MPLWKLKSLQARLFTIVLLAMLPALFMALLMALDRYTEAKRAAVASSQQLARSYSAEGRMLFDRAKTVMGKMAADHAAHLPGGQACTQALSLHSRLYPEYADLTLSLPDGRILCGGSPGRLTLAAEPWFKETLRERTLVVGRYAGSPTAGMGGDPARLPLALPVQGPDGTARAVLSMSLDLRTLAGILDDMPLPEGAAVTLIDRSGVILARFPEAPDTLGRMAPDADGFLSGLLANGQATWQSVGVDGVERIYFLSSLLEQRDRGLFLRIGMPSAVAFAGAKAELSRNLGLLAAMTSLALLLTWLFSSAMVLSQVKKLWLATRKLAEGDLSHRIGMTGSGELAELAMAFDSMAGALESHTSLLVRAERRYRDIFDNSVGGIFQTTPEGRIRSANPALARMLGYGSPEELMGSVQDVGREIYADPGTRQEVLGRLRREGVLQGHELRARHKDGRLLWLSLDARATLDASGAVVGYEGTATDITYRKAMEETLRAKQEKLQALMDNSPTLISIKDEHGRFVMANRRHQELHGLPQDCAGKAVEDIFPPEEAWRIREEDRRVLAAGRSMTFQRSLSVGGQQRYFLVVKFPLCDETGRPNRVCGIAYDMTDYELVREALRQSEEKYRTMVQTSPDLIWMLDPEGFVVEANNASRELLGYDPAELRGLSFRLLFHPKDVAAHDREQVLPRLAGQKCGSLPPPKLINERRQPPRATQHLEVRLIPKAGAEQPEPRHFELSSCGLWRDMAFLGSMVVIRDISERRRAVAALRESRELLAHTQAIGRIGGWTINLDTRERQWTDELRRMLGVAGEHLPDFEDCASFVDPEDRARYLEAVRRAQEHGEAFDLELMLARTGTEQRWVRFMGRRMDRDGARILSGSVQDITDKKSLEMLRDDIDSIIRHDLKSPLNGIINLPRLILDDNNLSEAQVEYLLYIEESGRKMLRQVEMSLDILKIERGQHQAEPGPMDLLPVLREILGGMREAARRKGCALEIELDGRPVDENSAFPVLAEERLCYPMLANLLQNALEASPPGERVLISLGPGPGPEVRIRNQGAVPEEIRERFFEKYVTRGKRRGTGLGTYSASLFARVQGGGVRLDASEEGATTVVVRLPGAIAH